MASAFIPDSAKDPECKETIATLSDLLAALQANKQWDQEQMHEVHDVLNNGRSVLDERFARGSQEIAKLRDIVSAGSGEFRARHDSEN